MPRLLIANDRPGLFCGHSAEYGKEMAVRALLLLWHSENDDIIILPIKPDAGHLEYVTSCLGLQLESLRIIVAPPGVADNLSADRLTNPTLKNTVKKVLAGRRLKSVLPLTPDRAITTLAQSLNVEHLVPGAAFADQSGNIHANSKVIFRAIAAGIGLAIPSGSVVNSFQMAEEILADMLLNQDIAVIVKKDFSQGCKGNEILSRVDGIIPNGGRRGLVLPDRAAISSYLTENWDWLTNHDQHAFVVEHYIPNSRAIFAEFNLTDQGVKFAGLGEMIAAPLADGLVIPPTDLSTTTIAEIVADGLKLSQAVHSIGYRGTLSADAIITPDTTVLFSEYNGRITDSMHIYSAIGAKIVGNKWMQKRILLGRRGWRTPSFQAAVDMLIGSGLAFNPGTRRGIILTGTFCPARKVISYTVVAEDLMAAVNLEEALHQISPRVLECPNV